MSRNLLRSYGFHFPIDDTDHKRLVSLSEFVKKSTSYLNNFVNLLTFWKTCIKFQLEDIFYLKKEKRIYLLMGP